MSFKGKKLVGGLVIGALMMTSAIGYVDAAEGDPQDLPPVLSEGGALADSFHMEISAEIGLYSSYLWRGFSLNEDPTMLQGFTVATEHQVSFGVSGALELQNAADDDALEDTDKVDYWIEYTHDFEDVGELGTIIGAAGLRYYSFTSRGRRSSELYVKAKLDDPKLFSPSVILCIDYDDEGYDDPSSKGFYLAGSATYSLPVTDLLKDIPGTIDLGATLGINSDNWIDGAGFHLDLSASASVPLTDKIDFDPSLTITVPMGDYTDSDGADQGTGFALGFSLGFGF